jgi:hypothetical protein
MYYDDIAFFYLVIEFRASFAHVLVHIVILAYVSAVAPIEAQYCMLVGYVMPYPIDQHRTDAAAEMCCYVHYFHAVPRLSYLTGRSFVSQFF